MEAVVAEAYRNPAIYEDSATHQANWSSIQTTKISATRSSTLAISRQQVSPLHYLSVLSYNLTSLFVLCSDATTAIPFSFYYYGVILFYPIMILVIIHSYYAVLHHCSFLLAFLTSVYTNVEASSFFLFFFCCRPALLCLLINYSPIRRDDDDDESLNLVRK